MNKASDHTRIQLRYIAKSELDDWNLCLELIDVISDLIDVSDISSRESQVGSLVLRLGRELENRRSTSELVDQADEHLADLRKNGFSI